MIKRTLYHSQPLILAVLLCISSVVHASESEVLFDVRTVINKGGLSIAMPTITSGEIHKSLKQTQRLLNDDNDRLEKFIQSNKTSGGGLFLAAILPGGFMYLAIQQGKVASAEKELTITQKNIIELGYDEVSLTSVAIDIPFQQSQHYIIVASYP